MRIIPLFLLIASFLLLMDGGGAMDPNGGASEVGSAIDPDGARFCYTGCVDPNG